MGSVEPKLPEEQVATVATVAVAIGEVAAVAAGLEADMAVMYLGAEEPAEAEALSLEKLLKEVPLEVARQCLTHRAGR
jgi:hypothetical protein